MLCWREINVALFINRLFNSLFWFVSVHLFRLPLFLFVLCRMDFPMRRVMCAKDKAMVPYKGNQFLFHVGTFRLYLRTQLYSIICFYRPGRNLSCIHSSTIELPTQLLRRATRSERLTKMYSLPSP